MTLGRRVFRTCGMRVWLLLAALLPAVGCSTIEGYPVRWPWTKTSMLAEKYDLPAEDDTRYANPPSYPKETMTATLREKETKPGQAPSRFAGTTGMGPSVGGAGGAGGGYGR